MALPTITVSPSAAVQAYRRVDSGAFSATGSGADFGGTLQRAVEGAVDANREAEAKTMQAIAGNGSITDVVTAVAKAELALQTTVAVRDRVVQAYQDIMKMPI
ncbi:flagellar hook-basal body complex protein FliE [Limobrevibacterium gyesilva]|uniref:Flagellar hook-basal body complex protein FliE n=1 Tax=Limobrevibacterium gyesilva TaxID=2991712 RepID=A0AA42CDP1_9PROT|nr:flagellar hook-basal body complex protein FliE [Limobrevibacterium gyesilva]MCW3475098.1 flagellar hook-basal body complex protein FliE [Limobrevibacterium gyesilva]